MFKMKYTLLIVIMVCCKISYSQDIDEFIAQNLAENDITKILPPVDSLIALAVKNSPSLKYEDADQKYWKAREQLAKTKWLDYFYLEAVYNYGLFDNFNNLQLAGNASPNQTLVSTKSSRYTFGPSLKIPISAILNRKNTIRSAKAETERSKYRKEIVKTEIHELVITRYNDVVKAHRLYFIYGTIVDTYKVQSMRAKKEYTNGIITVAEYTRLHQMLNEAILAHEAQRSELTLSIMYLEGITGIKLKV